MKRRDFVKYLAYAGVALGVPGCMSNPQNPGTQSQSQLPAAQAQPSAPSVPKMVVAEGTDPETLMNKGLAALGGIEKFVKPGNVVTIKPNFSVPRTIEEAATTNSFLVAALVKQCFKAKAKEVRVIDHTFTNGRVCLEKSGMYANVTAAGGKAYVINENTPNFFSPVTIKGEILKTAQYSKDVLDADVFINFPILKHHSGTRLTIGVKNLMGLVWDRRIFHSTDLNKTIAELAAFKAPHLTILDATRGITARGPMGPGPIKECNQVVFSTEMVEVDAYAAELFDVDPASIGHLNEAVRLGLGSLDWKKLQLVKV
jgi:uncharacterized protein (DUF362 family)